MTFENLTEDQEQMLAADERRRYLVATFGPDVTLGLATDQAPAPGPRSSAARIDRDQQEAEREIHRRQHRDTIERAAKLRDDQQAYERVMEARETRRPSSPADQAGAARHIRRHNLAPRAKPAPSG